MDLNTLFRIDDLSRFVGIFVAVFTVLVTLYSFGFMRGRKDLFKYYLYILLTFIASLGAVFANNLVVFMVFWGFLGMLLYLLIDLGQTKRATYTAKKAFILIGGTDALMLLGLAFLWKLTGTLRIDQMSVAISAKTAGWAYICFAAGAFAKAGAMPFHTWVPDTAEDAPVPVTAYLPASLDKLLGIYFLARMTLDIFRMNAAANTWLMALGSVTIIAAVMMALVQHDLKRLLGYHAVSQVGYMIIGIGTGSLVGIAGGLFHMLNNAVYKSCLFFASGAVEKRAGTTNLEKLGGLFKVMPVTFMTFLIASLAISGVPPFNGFVSKWMIYQGIIDNGSAGGSLWIVWLIAAIFGSALTLASFMKLVHAVFLGQPSDKKLLTEDAKKKTPLAMLIPMVVLAALCVIFGVWAYSIPLKMFIFPAVGGAAILPGVWNAGIVTVLLLAGIAVGLVIYLLGTARKVRETAPFIGGEFASKQPQMRLSGVNFYATIEEMGLLKAIYRMAGMKFFDIYEIGSKLTFGFNKGLRYIHNGVLSTYLAWSLLGMGILFYFLLR